MFWAGLSGMAEIFGGVLAWLVLGSAISPVMMGAVMAAVAGIMIALSVDELMPLAKELDPQSNPSYGVLWDVSDGIKPGGFRNGGHWLSQCPHYFTCQFIT